MFFPFSLSLSTAKPRLLRSDPNLVAKGMPTQGNHVKFTDSFNKAEQDLSRELFAWYSTSFSMSMPPTAVDPPATEVYDFPSFDSTVISSYGFLDLDEIGYFWSVQRGDMVAETFSTGLDFVCKVALDVSVVRNVLYSDGVMWSLEINGQVIATFEVPRGYEGDLSVEQVLDAPIQGPIYTADLKVQNEILRFHGSHTFAFAGDEYAHQIAFTGCGAGHISYPTVPFTPDALPVHVTPPDITQAPSDPLGLDSTEVETDKADTMNLGPPVPSSRSGDDRKAGMAVGLVLGGALLIGSLLAVYMRRRNRISTGASVFSGDASIVVFS